MNIPLGLILRDDAIQVRSSISSSWSIFCKENRIVKIENSH